MIEQLNAWQSLKDQFDLSSLQIDLFKKYIDFLLQQNLKTRTFQFKYRLQVVRCKIKFKQTRI